MPPKLITSQSPAIETLDVSDYGEFFVGAKADLLWQDNLTVARLILSQEIRQKFGNSIIVGHDWVEAGDWGVEDSLVDFAERFTSVICPGFSEYFNPAEKGAMRIPRTTSSKYPRINEFHTDEEEDIHLSMVIHKKNKNPRQDVLRNIGTIFTAETDEKPDLRKCVVNGLLHDEALLFTSGRHTVSTLKNLKVSNQTNIPIGRDGSAYLINAKRKSSIA